MSFDDWFEHVTAFPPHEWQRQLGRSVACHDRLLRIPTGFGKTAGVALSWLHHRVVRGDEGWPRRLVFCLPMRVLVEQTQRALAAWIERAGLKVPVHVLMGGVEAERWVLDVDRPAILLGTQDMLLSRALNRGYGAARGVWPMEYGLLHQDALWILDEVQLMDVGLVTSAQLAAFRDQDVVMGRPRLRPVHTWWMSATLQPRWLETVDRPPIKDPPLHIPAAERHGGLFDVRKELAREPALVEPRAIAAHAREKHESGTLTLIVVNRVQRAVDIYDALVSLTYDGKGRTRAPKPGAPEIRLVHSRFRGAERARWAEAFLRRDAVLPQAGRMIVATQVVEAGVDISARTLVTDLAPWSSLVQRFGRAARYAGESGRVIVAGTVPDQEKDAAPYAMVELAAADEAIQRAVSHEFDASPRSVEAFEDGLAQRDAAFLRRLYPYAPLHVLRRRDADELFDTSADLSGSDLDVSRYIRSGQERDVRVFWRSFEHARSVDLPDSPRRDELCPVPVGDIRKWKAPAYLFDYLDGVWVRKDLARDRVVPGMTLLLRAEDGGYDTARGWEPSAPRVEVVGGSNAAGSPLVTTSSSEDSDALSAAPWKTIATHGRETEDQARAICTTLGLPADLTRIVTLAARWHDVGKAHEVFQAAIREDARSGRVAVRRDLAKAPDGAWKRPPYPARPGFRHELASTLALFEVLRRTEPFHTALLGPHRELLEATGLRVDVPATVAEHPLARQLAQLSARDFDLLAWLVCSHHGKVRCSWTSTPRDQDAHHGGIHGVCEGDALPKFALGDGAGTVVEVPAVPLSLSLASMGLGARYGASWGERVAGLMGAYGPFTLAYLEAVLRTADVRASMLTTEDPIA
jgi:CRISPR-associated endonuclease/helicase Cas3